MARLKSQGDVFASFGLVVTFWDRLGENEPGDDNKRPREREGTLGKGCGGGVGGSRSYSGRRGRGFMRASYDVTNGLSGGDW
jgi:hypothetical protein